MSIKSQPYDGDDELREIAARYEAAKAENKGIYLEPEEWASLADWYAVHFQKAMAFEAVEYGLKMYPGNTELLVELAYQLLQSPHKGRAEEVVEQIVEETPESTILRAHLLLMHDKGQEAEALLDTIEDKDELGNIVCIAYMYIDMKLPEKALVWVARGEDLYADDEHYIAVAADCFFALELYDKAANLFDKLIDIDPYSAPYWFGLARCHYERQMFDKVIEACDFAIVCDETIAPVYMVKGNAYTLLGNEEAALENYLQAEKYGYISHSFIDFFLGLCKVAQEEWKEGYKHLEKVLTSENYGEIHYPVLYMNLAMCLHHMGRYRKSHQYFRKTYALTPEDPQPYLIEGRFYVEEGEVEKGVDKWAQALACAPSVDTWYEIGLASMETGLTVYAQAAFERVKEMDPDFEGINERLTILFILINDKENCMKYNGLCKHPFKPEELDKFQEALQEKSGEELATAMKEIFNALH